MRKDYELAVEMIKRTGLDAQVVVVNKNNFTATGISVGQEGDKIKLCVYPPEEISGPRNITQYVLDVYYKNCDHAGDICKDFSLEDFELTTRLVNKTWNINFLREYVHREIADDLCEVLYLTKFINKEETANVVYPWLAVKDQSVEELFRKAHENNWARSKIMDMSQMNFELHSDNLLECDIDNISFMAVITNDENSYGTSNILDPKVQKRLVELYPEGFFLIPSSVHEWIAVSTHINNDANGIASMIKEVNATQVDAIEQLSNHPYKLVDGRIVSA